MRLHKLLVVDDNPETLETICMITRNMDFSSVVAAEGYDDAIIELTKSPDLNLIICDWNMPEKNGLDLLQHLRRSGNSIPFIMVTARKDVASVLAAKENGVDLYICKPFSMDELGMKIEWILKEHQINPLNGVSNLHFDDTGSKIQNPQ